MKNIVYYFILAAIILGCAKQEEDAPDNSGARELSIFFINDPHAQINNFPKIKQIIDMERQQKPVIVACAGDIFSGNPVVDYYPDKGYPMIDLMNLTGFDISVIGNHEYDYGQEITGQRMDQATFKWVCANVDMNNTGVPEPYEYYTINTDDLRITFLGLVETDGKQNSIIPSTHPFKVQNFTFERPENVVSQYSDVKSSENSDLYIALTHLGFNYSNGIMGDVQLAEMYPYFDLIIGGHTHSEADTTVNGIYIYQSGSYLQKLGKIELQINDRQVVHEEFHLINLDIYPDADPVMESTVINYNQVMEAELSEVIGYSHQYHNKPKVGCFYTDALRIRMDVDICFQNHGGIRAGLDEGEITIGEVYAFDPFNNGAMVFEMSISEIKNFLKGTSAGYYYSGIQLSQQGSEIVITDMENNIIPDDVVKRIGINDYIPAVWDMYFPEDGDIQEYSTAEAIIYYLKHINSEVDYPACGRYFKYNN